MYLGYYFFERFPTVHTPYHCKLYSNCVYYMFNHFREQKNMVKLQVMHIISINTLGNWLNNATPDHKNKIKK